MEMKFRLRKGGLEESMKTMRTFSDWNKFCEYLIELFGHHIDISTVKIEPYDNEPDKRIGWNKTCVVLVKWIGEKGLQPIGFTDCLKEEFLK